MPRIKLPKDPAAIANLAEDIFYKHNSEGAASVLGSIDWDDINTKKDIVAAKHAEAKELERQMEQAYEERNAAMKPTLEAIRKSRDILKGVHRGELRKLGEWGFTIDG